MTWANSLNRRCRMNLMRNVGNLSGMFILIIVLVCFLIDVLPLDLSQRRRNRNPSIKRVVFVQLLLPRRRRKVKKFVHLVERHRQHRAEHRIFELDYVSLLCYDLFLYVKFFFMNIHIWNIYIHTYISYKGFNQLINGSQAVIYPLPFSFSLLPGLTSV